MRILTLLSIATIVTAILPLWLLVKTMTFTIGFIYFTIFPIAVNHPEYRLLVSPAQWLLWNIPTHGKSMMSEVYPF